MFITYYTISTSHDHPAGVDFVATTINGVIAPGTDRTSIMVPIIQDSVIENINETFSMRLRLPSPIPGVTLGRDTATGHIIDTTGTVMATVYCYWCYWLMCSASVIPAA